MCVDDVKVLKSPELVESHIVPAAEAREEKEIHASPSDLEEGEISASLPEEEVNSIDSLLPDWFTGKTVVSR